MPRLLDIFHASLIISVARAGWDEYVKELNSLQFQNSSAFRRHMLPIISVAEVPPKIDFPCEPYELENKTLSVHYLRPADIKVVGALGDSITAGNGILAKTVFGSLVQFRGYSWDVGGQSVYDDNSKTIPNILKHYNPDLTGYSTGTGQQGSEVTRCNVAAPGNQATDMPGQAKLLVEKLKTLEGSSFQDDWKLITIFIGGNDLCSYCKDPNFYSPQQYAKFISEALDELAANVPRAFVNLVGMWDVAAFGDLKGGIICQILQWAECKCALDEATRPLIQEIILEYNRHLVDLLTSGRYDTRDDFTVVRQPFLVERDIPRTEGGEGDLSYFAHDCFHLNQKGHNAMATALWNSMFEPVGKKSTKGSFTADLYCPRKDEPFATYKNSRGIKETSARVKTLNANNVEGEKEHPQGQIKAGRRSNDVIQDSDNHVFGYLMYSVVSVALLGYGTFFLFQWSVNAVKQFKRSRIENRSRNSLIGSQPVTSYQSISEVSAVI